MRTTTTKSKKKTGVARKKIAAPRGKAITRSTKARAKVTARKSSGRSVNGYAKAA